MTKPWETYEAIIKALYQKHTLATVRQIMHDQYGFKASTRAYRQKLDAWGCSKYKKRDKSFPSPTSRREASSSACKAGADTTTYSSPSPVISSSQQHGHGPSYSSQPQHVTSVDHGVILTTTSGSSSSDSLAWAPIMGNQTYDVSSAYPHEMPTTTSLAVPLVPSQSLSYSSHPSDYWNTITGPMYDAPVSPPMGHHQGGMVSPPGSSYMYGPVTGSTTAAAAVPSHHPHHHHQHHSMSSYPPPGGAYGSDLELEVEDDDAGTDYSAGGGETPYYSWSGTSTDHHHQQQQHHHHNHPAHQHPSQAGQVHGHGGHGGHHA